MSLLPLTGLPDPEFVARDPQAIVGDTVAQYETLTGRTLYPAQVERLLIDLMAYRETLTREAIQDAAKQNLVSFARGEFLDYLGELLGCRRLGGAAPRVLMAFTFRAPAREDFLIPAGTRVQDAGGKYTFSTIADTPVAAGAASAEAWAEALDTGIAGNGLSPGQISVLLDPMTYPCTVANLGNSYGGGAREGDTRFRDRVRLAAERPACGTLAAYRYHALSAHLDLVDVGVTSDVPGAVRVSALTAAGAPDAALLTLLRAALSRADVRPLTDQVIVVAPARVPYRIAARLTLYSGALAADAQRQALERITAWGDAQRVRLGRDLVPSQIIECLQGVSGVYGVELSEPGCRVLSEHEWADCTEIDVTIVGDADG